MSAPRARYLKENVKITEFLNFVVVSAIELDSVVRNMTKLQRSSAPTAYPQFERFHGGVLGYGWEIVQKLVKSLPTFEVIRQGLKPHAGASENRSPSEDVLILDDDVARLHICCHFIAAHRPSIP
jgi:hypothetical protein